MFLYSKNSAYFPCDFCFGYPVFKDQSHEYEYPSVFCGSILKLNIILNIYAFMSPKLLFMLFMV